jgi:8-oxo-dGTP pyrophosphatase MutT (NUDIX family)
MNALIACLRAVNRPDDIDEWLQTDQRIPGISVPPDYLRGVFDVLSALGVLSENGASSTNAYYFVQSLIAGVRDEAFTPEMWQGLSGKDCSGTGASLVRLLESYRLHCTPDPTPLRTLSAVAAVIKAHGPDDDMYLMQYDEKAQQFQPLGGKREHFDASNEDALIRELCEELNIPSLKAGVDLDIVPLEENVGSKEVSASLNLITRYDHSFYLLKNVRFNLPVDKITRWIKASEIAAGKTNDGQVITPLVKPYTGKSLDYSLSEPV